MSTLYASLVIILPLSGAFSFLLMMLLLHQGEICPGQRSRMSQQMATLWSLTALATLSAFASFQWQQPTTYLLLLTTLIGLALSIKQTRLAGKRALTNKVWWYAGIPLLIASVWIALRSPWSIPVSMLSALAITHWLIVRAAHRLKAFDKLLPLGGIIMLAITVCLSALQIWFSYGLVDMAQVTSIFIRLVSFALAGVLIWLLPQLRNMEPTAGQLAATSLCLVIAAVTSTQLTFLLN